MVNSYQLKKLKNLQKCLQKKNLLQKFSVLSTHLLQVSLDLSMQLCHNLQELWLLLEMLRLNKSLKVQN